MGRRPTQQHRAITAIANGQITRVMSETAATTRWSWQWWTGEVWRFVTGAENHALTALRQSDPKLVEVSEVKLSGTREDYKLTELGELQKRYWDQQYGPAPE